MYSYYLFIVFSLIILLPAGSRGLRGLIVAGRIWVGRGWVGGGVGMGGFRGGIGEWVGIPGTGIGELGCGKRGAGNGNPGIADFRNSRNSETGNGFGIDGCAQLCTRERNSAEFTPGNPPETTPETPRKPPN